MCSYFEDSNRIFLVTELCPGGNLYRYMRRHPNGLSEAQVRGVMRDILRGLQGFRPLQFSNGFRASLTSDHSPRPETIKHPLRQQHACCILHPQPIFMMSQKIADFGLARFFNDSVDEEQLTICGTANYISPEIVARQPYGPSTDIWSVGCIFVALLSGNPPFSV